MKQRLKYIGPLAVVVAFMLAIALLVIPADAAVMGPMSQFGEVHSCTTNGTAEVVTDDGGYHWDFVGGGGTYYPMVQFGVVHSFTTGGNANVATQDGGVIWAFWNGGSLFCSPSS